MKPLAPKTYIEISVNAGTEGEQSKKRIAAFFSACGIPAGEIVFFEQPENFRGVVYTRQRALLERVQAKLAVNVILRAKPEESKSRSFATLRMTPLTLKTKILTRKDWLDKWQTDYRMMPLGRKFMLVPFWQKKKFSAAAGRLPIYLDPKAAFGSGQHPSTQIAIALMEKVKGPLESCLDLGAGTGILSVAAHRLGAKTILAYDFDSVAFQAARFNLKLNGAAKFSVRRANVTRLTSHKQYDLVCANLTASILTQAKHFVFSSVRKGGSLILSGILSREINRFAEGFTHPGFRRVKLLKQKGWGGLLLKRMPG